ncbi:uncharacterized protein LOC114353299 [Ostrinia furnacalis]|uniref:uncharacterized protein LOC114353299 n=1 Tax=Ostrinia furnacalis TaxID=93504 RepID=UPI0010402DD7|nr:uncharacterized protein LOC114353299 [Ostrinia furnacalis]
MKTVLLLLCALASVFTMEIPHRPQQIRKTIENKNNDITDRFRNEETLTIQTVEAHNGNKQAVGEKKLTKRDIISQYCPTGKIEINGMCVTPDENIYIDDDDEFDSSTNSKLNVGESFNRLKKAIGEKELTRTKRELCNFCHFKGCPYGYIRINFKCFPEEDVNSEFIENEIKNNRIPGCPEGKFNYQDICIEDEYMYQF